MPGHRLLAALTTSLGLLLLAACSHTPAPPGSSGTPAANDRPERLREQDQKTANEIVLYAMGLLDTGYQFGGRNPEAGLDCSGMVSLVVEQVTRRKLPHNAARIAAETRTISRRELQPADLVFFNTNGSTFSHMGIYLGDGRFVHAPSSKGRVRVDRLDMAYYAQRFTGARSLFK
ncbi:C40 family peptidase [Uliginosibacterium sp. 31-16]|nr:C40 family peptidase [Uliginosibacterium sp. 31-16]MDP5240600.1 C40 family peptidase [Uliginosibacterium sp. 31-16]